MPRSMLRPTPLFVHSWPLLGGLVVVLAGMAARAPAESFREQVEADWARQETCRLTQLQQPGILRFPTGEVAWEGIPGSEPAASGGVLRVPKTPSPKLDGRLDDPCWRGAAAVPPGAGRRRCFDTGRSHR